jgi:hypothetical protein
MTEIDRSVIELRSDVLLKVCRHEGLQVSRPQAIAAVQACVLLESALSAVKDQQSLLERALRKLILTSRLFSLAR